MKKKRSSKHNNAELTLLSLPTVLWYIAFCYLPLFGIIIAFKRYRLVPGQGFFYSLIRGSDGVGLSNFRFLILNPQMLRVVRNTLFYNIAFLILGTAVPVTLAVILSYIHSGTVRSVTQIYASASFYVLGDSQLFCFCFPFSRQRHDKYGI